MDDRALETKKVGIWGISGNIFLLIIKSIVGFMFHSQAMIADSINSAGDIFASLMTFIGNKIASEPRDSDHNFGHGKAEYIFSLFIAISMILASAKMLFDSAKSFFMIITTGNTSFTFSWFLVIICIITIIVKLFLYFYTRKLCKKYKNILLIANMQDHRNDCILTTLTLISALLAAKGIFWFDSLAGLGISIWIFYTGIKIFMESYNVLMDISIDENTNDIILDVANAFDEIKGINSLYSSPVGYKYMIFITISVDGNMSTFDSHKLADQLEKNIDSIEKVYKSIVHVEPI